MADLKGASNPYTTGGGGIHFENEVQTGFVVLMLANGNCPVLKTPISRVSMQARARRVQTDDLVVDATKNSAKLVAQIKHSIGIGDNKKFGEVIAAAWKDYCEESFLPGRDAIALITGSLSKTDVNDSRRILEWARCMSDSEFFEQVRKSEGSSVGKKQKLKAFEKHLADAKGAALSDHEVWRFLRSYYLLGFDLDVKAGISAILLQTLIAQYAPERTEDIWARLYREVAHVSENGGSISVQDVPTDILQAFQAPPSRTIPSELRRAEGLPSLSAGKI